MYSRIGKGAKHCLIFDLLFLHKCYFVQNRLLSSVVRNLSRILKYLPISKGIIECILINKLPWSKIPFHLPIQPHLIFVVLLFLQNLSWNFIHKHENGDVARCIQNLLSINSQKEEMFCYVLFCCFFFLPSSAIVPSINTVSVWQKVDHLIIEWMIVHSRVSNPLWRQVR